MSYIDVLCVAMILGGGYLVYWEKKRRFDRVNHLGIEEFPSYRHKVACRLADTLIASTGTGAVGAAVVMLLIAHAAEYLMLAFILYIAIKIDHERHSRR